MINFTIQRMYGTCTLPSTYPCGVGHIVEQQVCWHRAVLTELQFGDISSVLNLAVHTSHLH
jgi:hypothetical protein